MISIFSSVYAEFGNRNASYDARERVYTTVLQRHAQKCASTQLCTLNSWQMGTIIKIRSIHPMSSSRPCYFLFFSRFIEIKISPKQPLFLLSLKINQPGCNRNRIHLVEDTRSPPQVRIFQHICQPQNLCS